MKPHWSSPDAHGRQRCLACRGNGYRFGKLRAAEPCGECLGKGFRFVKGVMS